MAPEVVTSGVSSRVRRCNGPGACPRSGAYLLVIRLGLAHIARPGKSDAWKPPFTNDC
jgi:hypothetical protein